MPRVSDEYMARRRGEILEAATACFAREGFHATSMRDIYRECGLSAGAVYNHFASKQEIVRALGEERLRDAQRQREALKLIEDPVEALRLLAAGTRERLVREEDRRRADRPRAEDRTPGFARRRRRASACSDRRLPGGGGADGDRRSA
jgi:AcrR family transcriptional regulator